MKIDESMIHGSVEPGFEKVREAFIENFKKGREIGAAYSVYHKGKKAVDLWGGYRDKKSKDPWKEDTMVLVFSTTKGFSSIATAVAHSKGYFEYDEKVEKYWPEFAQNGKEDITVRQLLSQQAGLCIIDEPIEFDTVIDPEKLGEKLAKQKPIWKPGTKHGYHETIGFYQSQLIRRTDPKHRTIGQFLADEIAKPLGLDIYIGLPDDIPDSRIANIDYPLIVLRMLLYGILHARSDKASFRLIKAYLNKNSITSRTFSNPKMTDDFGLKNTREYRRIEMPADNGICQARDLARLYGMLATGGKELGLKSETFEAITTPANKPEQGLFDQVLVDEMRYSLSFMKPLPDWDFAAMEYPLYGTGQKAFGNPGFGGSYGLADPDTQTGVTYVMNKLHPAERHDPRGIALHKATFECIKGL